VADETEWIPVEITAKKGNSVKGGRAEIEWKLTEQADQAWIRAFTPSGERAGSSAFELSRDEPKAYIGRIIWEVPEQDVESAHAYVRSSVVATNNRKSLMNSSSEW
jgi:hypothetical protein